MPDRRRCAGTSATHTRNTCCDSAPKGGSLCTNSGLREFWLSGLFRLPRPTVMGVWHRDRGHATGASHRATMSADEPSQPGPMPDPSMARARPHGCQILRMPRIPVDQAAETVSIAMITQIATNWAATRKRMKLWLAFWVRPARWFHRPSRRPRAIAPARRMPA